ncbi:MAG TPA: hypothetical protein VFH19_04600 [Nitrososphaeraceae archaeon]|nr:hypothetical protein [Nitrososphaeraceae archaeon]
MKKLPREYACVHIYANTRGQSIEEAFNTLLKTKMTAIDNKIRLAPVDSK